jgi:hypothetical protein
MPAPIAPLDNPVNPFDPNSGYGAYTGQAGVPAGTGTGGTNGTGLIPSVGDPTQGFTAGIDQGVQATTAQRLGYGNNPNVITDPATGKLYSTPTQVRPRDTLGTYQGTDGNYYQKNAQGNWTKLTLDKNGNTTGIEYVDPHDQRLKGLTNVSYKAGPAAAPTDLHAVDPGWQIEQGVADAAQLDPAKNAALQAAGLTANRLASGAVGNELAAQINPYLDATQQRIGQQASDLDIIRNSAMGRGPSAAEALAKSQLDANIRSQSALAATARGGNIAAAMRQAANSGTQQSLQSAQTLNALRAQEQLNAQGLLTTGANNLTSAQGRLGDQGAALGTTRAQLVQAGGGAQAGVAAQAANSLANMNAASQQAKSKYAEYLMNLYQISSGNNVSYSGQGVQAGIANQNTGTQLVGAGLNSGGALAAGALAA